MFTTYTIKVNVILLSLNGVELIKIYLKNKQLKIPGFEI